MGFISLLLTVTQNGITKICVRPSLTLHMLPCNLHDAPANHESHFQTFFPGTARRLLSGEHSTPESASKIGYCSRKVTPLSLSLSLTFLFLDRISSHLLTNPTATPFYFFHFSAQGAFIICGSTSPPSHLHFCPRCRTRLLFRAHRCLWRRQS